MPRPAALAATLVLALLPVLEPAQAGEGSLRSRLIFPFQGKHVHSSSIVELPGGGFLACWYHGSGERRANDVVIQGARYGRGAASWSPVFLMADTPGLPDCNPVLFADARGRLWLFWVAVQANRWECSILKYRRADEPAGDGPPRWSWQDVIHLVPGGRFAQAVQEDFARMRLDEGLWAEYALPYSRMIVEAARDPRKRQFGWMPRIHPVALPGGRILLPLYSDGFNLSLMALSDDLGETWRASRPIVGLGPIQPSVVRRRDGTLVAYMRDSGGAPPRVLRSTSADGGETWSIAADTEIPNPGSSLEVIALRDGRWVMVFNDTESGRRRLAAALSEDEGATWPWKRRLEDAPEGERGSFSYPSLLEARDGAIHVTYSCVTAAGATIKHCTFDADWIRGGAGRR